MKQNLPFAGQLAATPISLWRRIILRRPWWSGSARFSSRIGRLSLLAGLALAPAYGWAQCNTSATTTLSFTDTNPARPTGENWNGHLPTGVPEPLGATQVSSSVLTGASGTSSLLIDTPGGAKTLTWTSDFSASNGFVNVTFTFNRPLSNFKVNISNINISRKTAGLLGADYTDEVVVNGANGATSTPVANISLATLAGSATISGNVATGQTTANATVQASFASAITSLTLTFRNGTASFTNPDEQIIGIDQMTWCRLAPLATNATTSTVPSTATQVGINTLTSSVDGAVQSYLITSLPTRGTLFYNTTGTTYAAITSIPAGGFVLTPAQAASLRYTPDGTFTGSSATFTYQVRDDANLTSTNTATYTIPLQYLAACGTNPGTTTLAFGSRPAGEDWKSHAAEAVPAGSTATLISSGNYQNGAATVSTLVVGPVNSQTLQWNNDFAAGSTKTSQVTFTFTRPLSNFTVQVQDIDAGTDFVDQVTFAGANGVTAVTPLLSAANPGAGITSISGNVATGQNVTSSPVDGTVTAYFSSPITSLTITYNNATTANDGATQYIGIDQMTWCRALPTAVDVTSAALLSSIGTASISPLASTADNVPVTYTLTSIPTPAQGVLSYNSGGTTYSNITAAGQVLTAAQAASLRFTPVAGSSGNVTFTYRATDALNNLSANTATYTLPVVNAPCTTATAELNFRTSTPVPDDWKAHAPVNVGNSLTTVSTSNYQIAAGATTNTFSVISGTATNNVNGVQNLAWATDYASQANNTASVTFNFSRAVSNYTIRVQDIDRGESGSTAFADQVTFVGNNGGTTVLPALAAVGATNSVNISGNVATGTADVSTTNPTDGTVVAYFASPITSLTLTYRNVSTFAADPSLNIIGIELMNLCRLAPVAANVTNTSRPSGQGAAAINPLSATAPDGTITSYTITALPSAAQGTFYVNGVALTASTLTLTPAQAAQLSFAPAAGFSGNAGFSYYATDNAGVVSNTATYTVPVTNSGAAGTPAACGTPGKDGSPTIADNPDTYYPSVDAQALAAGATSISVGTATVGGTTTTPTSIVRGDLLLVMQMQGADINFTNSDSYGDGVAGGGASGNLGTNLTAGTYEYVVASNATPIAAATGGTITLATPLVNSYVNAPATTTAGPRRFQVIRVPQYGNLTLGGTLAATPWNGSTGGVLVLDVAGQTNFSGNTITAAGRGFRGGGGRTQSATNYDSPDYVNLTASDFNAQKGEGIAGTPRFVNVPGTPDNAATNATVNTGVEGYPGSSTSRGAPGNAGGGGNDDLNNSGGGGGANGGSGGRGGNNFSSNKAIGGEPGAAFVLTSSSRLVLGGGGGAGSTNNSTGTPGSGFASSGAAGGGIIILRTGTGAGTGTISANGSNANSTVADDGGGGGGAGGSILLTANSPASLSGLTLTANGGTGGTASGGTSGPHGPGGGGGGGVILTNGAVAATSALGAASGTTQGTPANFGAAPGLNGITNTGISNSIAGNTVGTTCAADVTVALAGPATLAPATPSGTYRVTFANQGPATATNVTRTVTLPAGATNILVNGSPYSPTTANTIDFGTAASVASGASSTFTFSFTPATTATGSAAITSNVATASGQGADQAPNTSAINAVIPPVANVATTITAGTPVAAGTLASVATAPKFTVNFTNNGPSPAAGVVASVQLPRGLTNVTATNGGVYSSATGLVTYAGLTALGTGTTTTSLINFDAPVTTPVAATASISTTTSEAGQTADDQASASYGITPAFDLAASLSGPASAVATDLVTLHLTMTNNGPSAVPNAVQTAQLATGLGSVYVSNGGFYNNGTANTTVTYGGVAYTVPAGGVIYPPLANLPSGQTVTNSVSFAMPGTAFKPTASVSTTTAGETATANNAANLNNAASTTAPAATLSVASPVGNPANVYTTLSATATAANNVTVSVVTGNRGSLGSTSASGIVETVQLLPGLTNVAITDSTGAALSGASYNATTGLVTFGSVSLASGAKLRNLITFTAPAGVGNDGQLLLTAAVTTANLDPVPADNLAAATVVVSPTTDLATTLTGPASATVGQPVQYTATFTNSGPMTASGYNASGTLTSGIFATAQLPVGLGSVAITDATGATVSGATYNAATGLVTFPAPTMAMAGTTQVYNLRFVAPAQSLTVRTSVGSAATDLTLTNNSAAVTTTVTPTADLVTSVAGPATAPVGNPVTYTVNTTNNGTSAAATVVPTLQLPLGFTAATLQVNGQTGTLSGAVINYPSGASYDTGSGFVTFASTASLPTGASVLNRVTFLMPSPASGQVAGVATATSTTADLTPGNNSTSVATSIAPVTATTADLVASVSSSPSPAPAGVPVTLTATFQNTGPGAATNVLPTLQLPAGLTGVTVSDNGSYNAATGLVTWPAILSQANGSLASYTATFPAPGAGSFVALASVSSDTSEPNNGTAQGNNAGTGTVTVTPVYDVVTRISGPATALAGTSQTYTVTTLDNGPSAVPNTVGSPTIQKVTVPAGQVPTNITGGGVYSSADNSITWTITAAQVAGAAGAVTNSFTIVQPAGGYSPVATVATPGDSNLDPLGNTASVTTALPNQPPTAVAVVNSLRSPQGNTAANSTTAPFGQLISPLAALDPENALSSSAAFRITAIPAASQGTLYYSNGGSYTAVTGAQNLTAAQAASLRFLPTLGYVGNATFSYLATDNAGNQSPAVTYTIPVGTDLNATYATYNQAKGGATPYQTGDVLAQPTDPNAATYNSTGALYNAATGAQLAGTGNGLSSAVLTAGTLPSGVSLDPATGRLYVSNAAALANNANAQTYTVSITTTDAYGGVTTVPVTFTIGARPLPVVLSAFTAVGVGNRDAQLDWSTASEVNSASFEVERSFDGTSFTKIGQRTAQGTSSSPSVYAFTDQNVASLATTGTVYYRLRQVDLDGKAAYSPVRPVSFRKAATVMLSLYPNPAQSQTSLDLRQLPASNSYQVTLLDAAGRTLRQLTLGGGQLQSLEVASLATGSYLVLVTGIQADGSVLRQSLRLTKE